MLRIQAAGTAGGRVRGQKWGGVDLQWRASAFDIWNGFHALCLWARFRLRRRIDCRSTKKARFPGPFLWGKRMRLDFCVACGRKSDLDHHHVVPIRRGFQETDLEERSRLSRRPRWSPATPTQRQHTLTTL